MNKILKIKLLLIVCCAFLGWQSVSRAYALSQDNQLFRQGKHTVEVYLADNVLNERQSGKRNKTSEYSANLKFQTKEGQWIIVKNGFILPNEKDNLMRGESIQREYAVKNPQKLRVANRPEVSPTGEFAFGLVVILLGLYLIWNVYQTYQKQNEE